MNVDTVKLKAYLDRLDAEANARDKHSEQIRDIVKAAKGDGFDGKALRKVFVRRRMDADKRQHDDDLLDIYEHALGAKGRALAAIASGVPSGEAAKTNGIHRATVARARHVAKQVDNATPHDPETGEVHGEDDQPGAAEVSGRTDEGTQGGGGAAQVCGGDELPSGQARPEGHAAGGAERSELGAGRATENADAVRVESGHPGAAESCGGRGVEASAHDNPAPRGPEPSAGAGYDQQTRTVAVRRDTDAPDVGNVAKPETTRESAPRSSPPQDLIDTTLPAFLDRRPKQDAEASVSPERSEAVT